MFDLKEINNIKLTPHFRLSEFACRCCHHVCIDGRVPILLEGLRAMVGKPIFINSAYRCPSHNKAVGGAKASKHMDGTAIDIRCQGMQPEELARFARKIGFYGIGIYPGFIHADLGPVREWQG